MGVVYSGGRGHMGSKRVMRGGSWNNNARNVRAATRNWNSPENRNNNVGFRLARAQTLARRPAPDPTFAPPVVLALVPGRRQTALGAGVRVGRWMPPRKLTGAFFCGAP